MTVPTLTDGGIGYMYVVRFKGQRRERIALP